MKPSRAMTIRLDLELAEALETVANVEERPISDVIRAAIDEHIATRSRDPKFRAGLRARIERDNRLLHR